MSDSTIYFLITLGGLMSLFLLVYIYKKYNQLKKLQTAKQEQVERLSKAQQEKYTYVLESLKILSQALITDQVGVIEGSIRIKVLIDHHDPSLHQNNSYTVFSDIFKKTEHIPMLKAWKALDKLSKRKYESFMVDIEANRGKEVKEAAVKLNAALNQAIH